MSDRNFNSELSESEAEICCHPGHTCYKMIALILMCFLGFGSFFCFDIPASLESEFMRDMNLTKTEYGNLYSWYAWPNVVCCFIGGFLIDRVFGIRLGTTIFSILVVIGQVVFAYGAYIDSIVVAILGRFIFGIGGESLAVAQNNYAVLWFKGKALNMVFGFQLSLSRLGSTVNMYIVEPTYLYIEKFGLVGYQTLGIVLLLAAVTCILSLVFSLILGYLDKRAQRVLNRRDPGETEVARLSDVAHFPISLWLVTLVIVTYYCSIFPFIAFAKEFFEVRFNMDEETANHVNSIVYVTSAFLSPVMGLLVDATGRNVFWVFISLAIALLSHVAVTFTPIDPHITMTVMGISYSMVAAALWPMIALIIPEHQLGTAYGIAQSFQNLGLAVSSILVGVLIDTAKEDKMLGYRWMEMLFFGYLTTSLLTIILLWILDDGVLNMSATQRSPPRIMRIEGPGDLEDLLSRNPGFVDENDDFISAIKARRSAIMKRSMDGNDENT